VLWLAINAVSNKAGVVFTEVFAVLRARSHDALISLPAVAFVIGGSIFDAANERRLTHIDDEDLLYFIVTGIDC